MADFVSYLSSGPRHRLMVGAAVAVHVGRIILHTVTAASLLESVRRAGTCNGSCCRCGIGKMLQSLPLHR